MTKRRFACLLLCILMAGCGDGSLDWKGMRETRKRQVLESVRTPSGLTGRYLMKCPAGDCIILHCPLRVDFQLDVAKVLEGDPRCAEDDGELLRDEDDSWALAALEAPAMFNCCTYAVAEAAGLTPRDWIEPYASGHTFFTQPMQVILDSYYRLIRTYDAPVTDWTRIAADTSLRQGDVLCFWVARSPRATKGAGWPEIVHAGRIHKKHGQNWLDSKINIGPLVRAPLRSTAWQFDDRFDQIRIYRAK